MPANPGHLLGENAHTECSMSRHSPPALEREGATLVLDQGYSCPEAAKSSSWVRQAYGAGSPDCNLNVKALRLLLRRSRLNGKRSRSLRPALLIPVRHPRTAASQTFGDA